MLRAVTLLSNGINKNVGIRMLREIIGRKCLVNTRLDILMRLMIRVRLFHKGGPSSVVFPLLPKLISSHIIFTFSKLYNNTKIRLGVNSGKLVAHLESTTF